jgi:hypothetical protein
MVIENYFDLPEVSSSDLGALERLFYGRPDNRAELEEIFNFGSLVDAMLTERELLDYTSCSLRVPGKLDIHYSPLVWRQAERLAGHLRKDPVVARMLPVMKGQYIFRRTLDFSYDGEEYKIRARCKFDLYTKLYQTGLDFKTTACKTKKEFVNAVDHFDWDKQGAWYMDLARIDYHWIVGVSKVTGEIFKHVIERGDATHKRGVEKYSVWAYRWLILIEPFEKQLLKLAA